MQTRAKYKICRRLGAGIFEKCQTPKFAASAQKKAQVRSSAKRPKAPSEYALQLIEKQKIRFGYGVSEKQLSNYAKASLSQKTTSIQDYLFESLETRLDNVVYRLGFAHTRRLARQMVSHGHFTVNGVRSTIPSQHVKVGDVIAVRQGSRSSSLFANFAEKAKQYKAPAWLTVSPEKMEATVASKPKNVEAFFNFGSVFEFYSR